MNMKKPLQIFPRDEGQVNDFTTTGTYPKISRVYSFETVTAEGARLRSSAPVKKDNDFQKSAANNPVNFFAKNKLAFI